VNRTLDLVMRNLRTEVKRLVKENEELKSLNHLKDELIARQEENLKACSEVKKNDRETS
jgi:hypothetical protein